LHEIYKDFSLQKDTQQSIYSVKFKDKNELGYQSDKAGFMDAGFNKAASLPKSLNKDSFTDSDLANLPKGYILQGMKGIDFNVYLSDRS